MTEAWWTESLGAGGGFLGQGVGVALKGPSHSSWVGSPGNQLGHLGVFQSHLINIAKELCFLPL